jgi:pimeloyl-ACP methyl ester carboxylesterase
MWLPLIRGLAMRYRCVTIDLPGHGKSLKTRPEAHGLLSSAQLVEEAIRRLESPMPILVGHDVGGAVALVHALSSRHSLPLVLINSSSPCTEMGGPPIGKWSGLGIGGRFWIHRLVRSCPNMHPHHARMLKAPWNHRESRDALVRSWEGYDESWPGLFDQARWRKEAEEYTSPVLLLWGSRDPLHPVEDAITMIQHLPDATLYQRDCGHWPCLEEPDWVETKIKEFLFRLEPASAYFSAGF